MQFLKLIILLLALMQSVFAARQEKGWIFEQYKGMQVPDDIPIFDHQLKKHYLEEYEGKTLLLTFWASWCSSCLQSLIDLDLLQKDFRKLPFEVIAVSEDYHGVKAIEDFYKMHEIRHLKVLHDYKNQLFKACGVVGIPTSFLITPQGLNIGSFKGIVNWHDEDVRRIILSHIEGNPEEPKNTYKASSLNQVIQKTHDINSNSNEVSINPSDLEEGDDEEENE